MEFKLKERITGDIIDDAILRTVDDLEYHKHPDDRYTTEVTDIPLFLKAVHLLYDNLSDADKNERIAIVVD